MKKIALLFAALLLVTVVGCSHDNLMDPKGSANGPTGIFNGDNSPTPPDEDED